MGCLTVRERALPAAAAMPPGPNGPSFSQWAAAEIRSTAVPTAEDEGEAGAAKPAGKQRKGKGKAAAGAEAEQEGGPVRLPMHVGQQLTGGRCLLVLCCCLLVFCLRTLPGCLLVFCLRTLPG